MKIYWNSILTVLKKKLLISLYFFLGCGLIAEAQELEGLFYCNSQYDFEEVWIVNENTFLGWYIDQGENLLISVSLENRLPVDTMRLGSTTANFLHNISFLSPTKFHVLTLNTYYQVELAAGIFNIQMKKPTVNDRFIYTIFKMDMGSISFDMRNLSKNKLKNHLVTFQSENTGIVQFDERRIKRNESLNSTHVGIMYHDQQNELSMIPSNFYSQLAIINWEKENIDYMKFPEIVDSKKEAYYVYFDHITNQLYLMHHKKGQPNRFYLVNIITKKITPVFEGEIIPYAIINGYYYFSKEQKDDISKVKSNCHYAIPINAELPEIKYLDEVLIDN